MLLYIEAVDKCNGFPDASGTDDRLLEEDDDDGLERGVIVVGVAADDAVYDTSLHVLHTQQFLQQMGRQAECAKFGAELRKHYSTSQHTAECEDIEKNCRNIRSRINWIMLNRELDLKFSRDLGPLGKDSGRLGKHYGSLGKDFGFLSKDSGFLGTDFGFFR